MSTRSQRMKSLIRIASHKREQAAHALNEARQERNRLDATLGLLRMHFEEYRLHHNRPGPATSMAQLGGFQEFVYKLQQAIEQQEQALQAADARCEQKRQAFLEMHQRFKALEKAQGRMAHGENRTREKQAQKQMDEMAARKRHGDLSNKMYKK